MPHKKHHHKHHSSSSSSSSSSSDETPNNCHTKKPHSWVEVKLPKRRCSTRKHTCDLVSGCNHSAFHSSPQIILAKKNSNIAPKNLSGPTHKRC
jgi:hypothetical protein